MIKNLHRYIRSMEMKRSESDPYVYRFQMEFYCGHPEGLKLFGFLMKIRNYIYFRSAQRLQG